MLRRFLSVFTLIFITVSMSLSAQAETIFDRLKNVAKEGMKEGSELDRSADFSYIEKAAEKAIKEDQFSKPLVWRNKRSGSQGTVTVAPESHRFELSKCFDYTRSQDGGRQYSGEICKKPIGPWMITQESILATQSTQSTSAKSDQVREAQQLLTQMGFQVGAADGILGTSTGNAISTYQQVAGLPVDGKVSNDLLTSLKQKVATSSQVQSVSATFNSITQADAKSADPIILTLDGLELDMSPGMSSILLGGFRAETRSESYLKPIIDEHWKFTSRIEHVGWSGNLDDTDVTVDNVKSQIRSLSTIAERKGRPFVIVAHSWGGVLAYRSILELIQEGKLEKGAIDQLITLGTPLNAQGKLQRLTSRNYDIWQGTMPLNGYVGDWRNYWMKPDDISGSIPGLPAGNNIELTKLTNDAHGDFWGKGGNFTHLDRIGADLNVSLKKKVPASSEENASLASSSTTSEVSTDSFCMSGVCLGDSIHDLASLDWSNGFHFQTIRGRHRNFDNIPDLNAQDLEVLKTLSKRKDYRGVFSLANSVRLFCAPYKAYGTLRSASGGGDVSVSFYTSLLQGGREQGLIVTRILRRYDVPTPQHGEWLRLVKERYPGVNKDKKGRELSYGFFPMGKKVRAFTSENTGELVLNFRIDNFDKTGKSREIAKNYAEHPDCRRVSLSLD